MSKIENAKTDRVLRDDELDAVSGGRPYDPSAGSVGFMYDLTQNRA